MLAHVGEREGLEADGVFSGGGIKGLAFAGALAGAEKSRLPPLARAGGNVGRRDHGDGARRGL